jgi:site-specific DNA-methyltransferase (adenine-specific)/modification methylase
MTKIVHIGNATLYLADSETLDLEADVVVADPVYGNGYKVNRKRTRASMLNWKALRPDRQVDPDWRDISDNKPFDPSRWLVFPEIILWGANHYASRLPDASCWLVWDKKCHTPSDNFSDCELAYTNLQGPVRKFSHLWRGLVRAGVENIVNGPKLHPWQKPEALMTWCVGMTKGRTVLDPYMGSGTTGMACIALDRHFIGVEKDEHYFNVACERLERANSQQRLNLVTPQ